ncbi:SusC/RagA family TonB-linked outer membrane protein [Pontibacter sp. BT731]|uniref:SusC/RagA family TonB-linked outer membrane protein n=1 Tax=Pontibacter coccineus TaxID=3063328 RepID=UPI0026E29BC0|nr:SusC/RagA family TonB-linked outer membrane protein [Pontibacter sp. BT731]MDO6391424.1 SusC/RagA family TonB-linked outer membrane protein [Pontibacter sp. BT731]
MKQILPQTIKFLRYSSVAFGLLTITSAASLGQNQPSADSTRFASVTVQVAYKPYELSASDLNKGVVTSVEHAIIGRFAGLRVVPAGGAPGTGAEMVHRSGTSLFGNNSPLVVIDGVLLDIFSHSLHASNLSWLNADDIASVSLLKDASATALYGGAAANGVLVITTKTGNAGDKIQLQYNATGAVSSLRKKADIFSAEEFRSLIRERYPNQQRLLGEHDTDWQDEIYRTGFGLTNKLSVSGAMGPVPYRVSVGQLKQNGILETSGYKRNTLSVNLQPSLFQKHLTFKLSLHNTRQELQLADERAIPAAMAFDPTQPVHADNKFGGYFAHTRPDGSLLVSQINPVSLLEQKENRENIRTLSGQAHVQYKLHFLPSLTANYRYAYLKSDSDYSSSWPFEMASGQWIPIDLITHRLASSITHSEGFVSMYQAIPSLRGKFDLTVGTLKTGREIESGSKEGKRDETFYSRGRTFWSKEKNFSYYGSLGYNLLDRFTFKASFRSLSDLNYNADELRHQSKAIGIGWDIGKESLMVKSDFVSHLKLKADIGRFSRMDEPNRFRTVIWTPVQGRVLEYGFTSPQPRIVTEKTLQKSLGLEFGLLQNRLMGNLSLFQNRSSDLLMFVRTASGSGTTIRYQSTGGLQVAGLETSLQYTLVQRESVHLKVGMNATFLRNRVTSMGDLQVYTFSDNDYGLRLAVDEPAQVFNLFNQLYDASGKPLQGGYEKNEYGYAERKPMGTNQPNTFFGISSNGGYRKWEMSFLVRGSVGQQVFNQADANRSWLYANDQYAYLSNATRSYLENGFISSHSESSHFLENASFLRLEYLQLGYNAGKILGSKLDMKVNATVQNAFVITRYSGQDQEVANGIDRGNYPQPRTFSLGLNLSI